MAGSENPNAVARRARMRAHVYRSVGVGLFSAWVVTIDQLLADTRISLLRFLGVAVCATLTWFVIGGGSGILWSYLPRSLTREHHGDAT